MFYCMFYFTCDRSLAVVSTVSHSVGAHAEALTAREDSSSSSSSEYETIRRPCQQRQWLRFYRATQSARYLL